VHVIINGDLQVVHDGLTIAELIAQLGLNQRRIAVEINREIIAREHYPQRRLNDGDAVEIVHFIGGG